MSQLQQLMERRANLWEAEYQPLLERVGKPDFGSEEREQLDRMANELATLSSDIERLEQGESLRGTSQPAPDPQPIRTSDNPEEQQRAAFDAYMRGGMASLEPEQRSALTFVSGAELRAQGVATNAAGGFLVPQGFRARIVESMKAFGSVESVADVINTDSGNTLPWPTVDDTANVGAILAENTQVTEQDVVLGQAQLGAHVYTSKLVRVSYQLLQDSAFDLEAFLARKLGERIARIRNQHYTTGTGTAQPEGVQTNATVGVTLPTGNTTTVTYDGLIDLITAPDPAYLTTGRARFMTSVAGLRSVLKLKDTQNRPLWEPSIQSGTPSMLLGYPITINQDMPAPAASVKSWLFGDFTEGYVVRNVTGVQLLRLEERYADFLQVGFLAFARSDAKPQNTGSYRALAQSAT